MAEMVKVTFEKLLEAAEKSARKSGDEDLVNFVASHQTEDWADVLVNIAQYETLAEVQQRSVITSCRTMQRRKHPVLRGRVRGTRAVRSKEALKAESAVKKLLLPHLQIFHDETERNGRRWYSFTYDNISVAIQFSDLVKKKKETPVATESSWSESTAEPTLPA